MDRGKDALLGNRAVQMHLHVASALELLEDQVIHPALGFDERRCHDGKASAFLDVASRAEEFPRPCERLGIDAAAHDAAFVWLEIVVASGHSRDGIEQDDDIFSQFDETFGPF